MARGRKSEKTIQSPNKTESSSSSKSKQVAPQKSLSKSQNISSQLRLSESYVSLILGAVVVLGVFVIFFIFIQESRKSSSISPEVLNQSIGPTTSPKSNQAYTLQENETLWDVAVKFYGDGFRYVEIVEANKDVIDNPDYVPPGTKIIIPNLQ